MWIHAWLCLCITITFVNRQILFCDMAESVNWFWLVTKSTSDKMVLRLSAFLK